MASIQINPTDEFPLLVERLTDLQERLNGDLTPLMQGIGKVLEDNTRQRIANKIAHRGNMAKPCPCHRCQKNQ